MSITELDKVFLDKVFSKIRIDTRSNKISWHKVDEQLKLDILFGNEDILYKGMPENAFYFTFGDGFFYLFEIHKKFHLCVQRNKDLPLIALESQDQEELKILHDYIIKSKETLDDFLQRFLSTNFNQNS